MRVPYITAHSGCENTPRDSMDAIERAAALGADIVEMDVRRAPDGVLRISHNRITPEEYEKKPTLMDVLRRLKDTDLSLNCDVKEQAALYDTLDMAASIGFGKERLVLSGCTSPEQIVRDSSLTEKARVYVNIEELLKFLYFAERAPAYTPAFGTLMTEPWVLLKEASLSGQWLDAVVRFAESFPVQGINLPFRCLTNDFVEKLHSAQIPFSVWTVNDPANMEYCIRANAENITTLEVKLALQRRKALCGF